MKKILICAGLLLIICAGYFFARKQIDKQIVLVQDDFMWVYQIDSLETRNGEHILKGFAFELDKDAAGNNYEIILQELETKENYFLLMEYSERKDVNDYFLCEYDYINSGFEAKIKEKKIDLLEKNYEVLLRMAGRKKAYRTGTYISKGKIVYVSPKEFVPLQVAGTGLEEIVEKGVLRVYRPEYGVYVYQYKGELYWIIEQDYGFVNGDTYMQYHLNTTQTSKLPKERLDNKWYWDNIGFLFSANEVQDFVCGKYRVARKSLPTQYAIEKIWTGNYINDWIWKNEFRPYYEF